MSEPASTARARGAARLLGFPAEATRSFHPELSGLFDGLNALHFDSALPPVPICRSIPDDLLRRQDRGDGLTRLRMYLQGDVPLASVTIYLSGWLFDSPAAPEEVRAELIRNALLHQMVHMAVHLDTLGGVHHFDDHHGQHFTQECNRISERSGWSLVLPSDQVLDDPHNSEDWPDNAMKVPEIRR